jgi:hypothetical protein
MAEPYAPKPIEVSIHTFLIGNEDRAFVLPPYFHVGKGATKVPSVQWENQTKKDVKLWFPNGWKLFKGDPSSFENPFTIRKDQKLTLYVNDGLTDGEYEYHVYCDETEDSAKGNSEPWGGRP